MIEEAASYGSELAPFVIIAGFILVCVVAANVAKFISSVRIGQQAMNDIKDAHGKKVLEEQEKDTRIAKLEGWTGRQQKDIKRVTGAITIMMVALRAILKHIIDNTGANGDCHKALDSINEYIEAKMNQTESQ